MGPELRVQFGHEHSSRRDGPGVELTHDEGNLTIVDLETQVTLENV